MINKFCWTVIELDWNTWMIYWRQIIWWRRPRLGECSLAAAAQENPGSLTHVSSTISSAPSSSSSSSTSSLSTQSDSSSMSHLPASLSSDSSGCNANLSVTSIPVEVFSNDDNDLEYFSPKPSPRRGQQQSAYAPNQQSTNSGRQRRRLRECIPLISNNHWRTNTYLSRCNLEHTRWYLSVFIGQWSTFLQVIILTRITDYWLGEKKGLQRSVRSSIFSK